MPNCNPLDEITTQNQITTFQLNANLSECKINKFRYSYQARTRKIKSRISSKREITSEGKGKDVLKGGDGADGFRSKTLTLGKESRSIKDFSYEEEIRSLSTKKS